MLDAIALIMARDNDPTEVETLRELEEMVWEISKDSGKPSENVKHDLQWRIDSLTGEQSFKGSRPIFVYYPKHQPSLAF